MSEISSRDISDEDLMAFADGELTGDRHALVAKIVADSTEAAERLAAFTATGRGLSGLFEQPMLEPVPQRLVDAIRDRADETAKATLASDNVIQMDARRRARPAAVTRFWYQAAAACALLAFVGAGVQSVLSGRNAPANADFALAGTTQDQRPGVRLAGGELAAALDVTPSGSSAVRAIAGTDAAIKPVFTFATVSGGYCRQYVIARVDSATSYAGVACREADGRWRVEIQQPVTTGPTTTGNSKSGQIIVAGKGGLAAVDAAVDKLISGSVLGTSDEAAVLKSGWQAVKP